MIFELSSLTTAQRQYYLQHVIAPRPICFASTVDKSGNINLSPFSFFNIFSSDPPIVIFSPSRRVRDNTTKHSLENVQEVPEVVINICTYDLVQQVSLSSTEYPKGVNEFIKSGLTMIPATRVKPPMVKECVAKMECRVIEIKPLGKSGGAGNLVICEVIVLHLEDDLLDDKKQIDQRKLNLVARLGGDWYCSVDEKNLFTVAKPLQKLGIGFDGLPEKIRESEFLSGNDLGKLANVESLPSIDPTFEDHQLKNIIQYFSIDPQEMEKELHKYASFLLHQDKVSEAWQVLLVDAEA